MYSTHICKFWRQMLYDKVIESNGEIEEGRE